MAETNGRRDEGITDSEHFSPYRADGKLVCVKFLNSRREKMARKFYREIIGVKKGHE